MSVVLLLARLLLAAIFGVAGVAKLADPKGSRQSMVDFGVPKALAPLLGVLFPIAEIVCAVALLPLASAWWGACGILALLLLFIVGISFNLVRGHRPDCHCFGQLQSSPIGWDLVARNSVLSAMAALVVWLGPGAGILNWSEGLSTAETLSIGLLVAVVALAAFQMWALLHVLRQNGRLLLRIEALESRPVGGTAAPEPPPPGLPVDSVAPEFSLQNLAGETVTFELLKQQDKPVLLFFSEPGCGACDTAYPEVAEWQREHADRLLIIPISRGSNAENLAKTQKFGITNVLLQKDRETAQAYLVDQNPSAVLVIGGRIASPLAIGIDAIRRVVIHATLPATVQKGDAVPAMRLPDLDGKVVNLADLKRRTMIVFWNPGCGFCQQMLGDLKAWEKNRGSEAPELLVISAGAPEEIRKEGFQADVLLDPYYAASQVFGSGGTPSAVLIDGTGQVASGVAVGAPEVLALASK